MNALATMVADGHLTPPDAADLGAAIDALCRLVMRGSLSDGTLNACLDLLAADLAGRSIASLREGCGV